MDKLQESLNITYYAEVSKLGKTRSAGGYYAYLPDFFPWNGHPYISAVGDTVSDVLRNLKKEKDFYVKGYLQAKKVLPEPVFRSEYPLLPEISSDMLGSCPLCGELSEITKVTDIETSVIKGVELAHPVTFFRCESCKDTFDTADTMDSSVKSAQDMYEEIRKLTEQDCAEIYEFAMKRSREILGGLVEDVAD